MPPAPLPDRVVTAMGGLFAHLAARPGLLLAICFALNAALLPYAGLYHDAELYSAQVVQAGTGRFAEDLFFKNGSQSRFTVFPVLLAVPVGWAGVEPVFLAAYVLSTVARLWATQRLILRLLGPTPAAAAGLVAAAVIPGWWGPACAFGVGENFFTARVPATALAVLALERAVAGRWAAAAGLVLAAGVVHPLVAAPVAGVLVGMVVLGWATTPSRRAAVSGAVVAGAAGWVALALTGATLDPQWRAWALDRNPILDPGRWWAIDTFRVGMGVACVAVAASLAGPVRGRFGWAVVAVAVGGFVGELAAVHGGWALGLQVQPARGLWPLELVRLPTGFYLAGRLWAGGPARRVAAIGLVLGLTAGPRWEEAACWLAFGAVFGLGLIGARAAGHAGGAAWVRGALIGAAGSAALCSVMTLAMAGGALADGETYRQVPLPRIIHCLQNSSGTLASAGAAVVLLVAAGRLVRADSIRAGVAVAAGLAATIGWQLFSLAEPVARTIDPRAPSVHYVRAVLDAYREPARTPVIYWPGPRLVQVWHGLGASGYYHHQQLAGNLFQRETAAEGQRRFDIVRSFEVDQERRGFDGAAPGRLGTPPPSAEEFRALMSQPGLDFVVLTADYGGAIATNGSVWVYRCPNGRSAPVCSSGAGSSPVR